MVALPQSPGSRSPSPCGCPRLPILAAVITGALLGCAWRAPLGGADYAHLGTVPLAGVDAVASNPYGIAFHPLEPLGYVALAGDVAPFGEPPEDHNGSTVAEVDLSTLSVTRSFPVGLFPTELVVTPDGAHLFVTCSTASALCRIDLATEEVTELPLTDSSGAAVSFPAGIALSPDAGEVWVTSNGGSFDGSSENLLIIDRATGAILERLVIAGGMSRFAVREDGRVVLPVGFPGDQFTAPPEVRIYDTTGGWSLLATLTLSVDTADFPAPYDARLSADGSRAYVSVFGGSSEIFVIDLVTLDLLPSLELPGGDFAQSGLGVTPDGAHLLVGEFFASQARVLDLASGAVVATLATGPLPNAVGVHGGRAWITSQGGEGVDLFALPGAFLRGDANGDRIIDIADGITILAYLFGPGSLSCEDAADSNDDGAIDLADPIGIFQFLFQPGSSPPAYPFPQVGDDLTGDALGCDG
ncbi:MAG: hypothetical protein ACE5GW_02840 [Planctomycetota bacterium]